MPPAGVFAAGVAGAVPGAGVGGPDPPGAFDAACCAAGGCEARGAAPAVTAAGGLGTSLASAPPEAAAGDGWLASGAPTVGSGMPVGAAAFRVSAGPPEDSLAGAVRQRAPAWTARRTAATPRLV